MMDKLSAALEKYLMPVGAFIGGQKHLVALRDGFIATLTVSMTGALASMVNGVFVNSDSFFGQYLNKIDAYAESVQPVLAKYVAPTMGAIWYGTTAILAVFILLSVAYSLARSYEVDGLAAALISLASYVILLPQFNAGVFTIDGETKEYVEGAGSLISTGHLGANSIFSCIIVALVATQLFVTFTKRGWTIKMPEQVPPAVSKSFAALIPGIVTLLIMGIVCQIFDKAVGKGFDQTVYDLIQKPLMALGQSPATYIFLIFLAQLLWFCGLHGSNMVDPALNSLYKPALVSNINAVANHQKPEFALTRNFVDVYAQPGGSGGTLALLICIFIFSKRQEAKELAKIAIGPAIFQINEPVIFGLPIVLNASYFIPFILSPTLCILIAWVFTAVIPFAGYLCIELPWTTPPVLSAFFGANGNWQAAVLALALLVLSVVIWAPFVIAANRMGDAQDA